jgi:hypothetical protein
VVAGISANRGRSGGSAMAGYRAGAPASDSSPEIVPMMEVPIVW